MTALMVRMQNAANDRERGAAMAEYGLLLVFVAIASIGIMLTFGSRVKASFGLANEVFDKSPAGKTTPPATN